MTSRRTGIVHQPLGQTTIEYLPLEEVKIRAWVVDVSSRIVLSQTFHNPSDQPTGRAKYVFPIPASAAVCAFELELDDGSVIVGEIKEREEAARTFTRAVEQNKVAALVETVTDDIFTISVGSISAASRVTAHLTFVMDLLDEALRDHIRLQLPMYIAERYGVQPEAMDDASAANSRTRLHISVDVQTSDIIYGIRSPTHRVELRRYIDRSGKKSQRHMSTIWQSTEFLSSDFVITIHAEGLDKPRCFAEVLRLEEAGAGDESTVAMQLTLVPKFLAPKIPSQEYIFVIDRSGSMSGSSIETAKATLNMLLRLLPSTGTTFNIFSFGSKVTSLWNASHALDPASLIEATSHVSGMKADYGGTEIPLALRSAFELRGRDRPAVMFLLTDGEIHVNVKLNALAIISEAVRNSGPRASVRLFVLGIGQGPSSDVCSSLARQGNGEYLFAASAEEIFSKCVQLMNAGRSKNIERIDIDWGDSSSSSAVGLSASSGPSLPVGITALEPPPSVQQAPHSLTRIFSGIRFTVFAITSFKAVPKSVRLIIKQDGVSEPQEIMVGVIKVKPFSDASEHSTIPVVHTLAARKLIMELDDGVGPLPKPVAGDALLASENDLRKAGIIRLGLTHRLMSKHTSFVAVQKGDERRRNKGRGSGNTTWARSRLRRFDKDIQDDVPAEAPTLLDGLIDGVASIFTSFFGLFSNPATLASSAGTTLNPRAHHQLPGALDESDSWISIERGRSPRRTSRSPRRQSSPSQHSIATFSSLSSLDGSTCSACWTISRSPSPHPPSQIERAPSPEFVQDPSAPGSGTTHARRRASHDNAHKRAPIPPEVYELFQQMNVDGSITATPLLKQLVGDTVLDKADALQIDETVWATVVLVAYIQLRLQREPGLLDLMSDKAKEFVEASAWSRTRGARAFDAMVRMAAELLDPSGP